MGKSKAFGALIRETEGSVAVITAICLVAFLACVSLVIDMGHLYTVRNELQNVADASALAAANALIVDSGGVAERDAVTSKQKAMEVAQDQSLASHQTVVEDTQRTDLTILFGTWNINAGDPSTAWTAIGSTCTSDSNANAVKVSIVRAAGTVYGPVSNLFAGILGFNASTVGATAIAYIGFTNEVVTGGVQVPLALPATGTNSPLAASNGHGGWLARLFGPKEALASTPKTITFRDTGGSTVTINSSKKIPTSPVAALDPNQPYFYTPKPNPSTNSVPDTVKNILKKIYTPNLTGTNSVPVFVGDITVGKQIYPASEYPWGSSNMKPIFDNLKAAYNAKKNSSTGKWRTTLVVHGVVSTSSLPQKTGFRSLARLLMGPFWASEAFACATIQPPTTFVKTFVNVDITEVKSGTGNDGDYTYPKKIRDTYTGNKNVTYTDQKDFLDHYPNSTWNVNTATIEVTTDSSTVSPPGSSSGGPSNQGVNPGAPTNTGAFATTAVLVK
jgi:Flp pilus assembly protein TadG